MLFTEKNFNDNFNPELLYCIGDDSDDSTFSVTGTPYLFPVAYRLQATQHNITLTTIEKLDLENMGIAVGILSVGATKIRYMWGVILPPAGHPKV